MDGASRGGAGVWNRNAALPDRVAADPQGRGTPVWGGPSITCFRNEIVCLGPAQSLEKTDDEGRLSYLIEIVMDFGLCDDRNVIAETAPNPYMLRKLHS